MWAGWLELLIGVWLIASPFVFEHGETAYWNDILIGLVTVVIAFLGLSERRPEWWVGVPVGVWLVVSPFLLGYADRIGPLWNDILAGLALIVVGLFYRWPTARRRGSSPAP